MVPSNCFEVIWRHLHDDVMQIDSPSSLETALADAGYCSLGTILSLTTEDVWSLSMRTDSPSSLDTQYRQRMKLLDLLLSFVDHKYDIHGEFTIAEGWTKITAHDLCMFAIAEGWTKITAHDLCMFAMNDLGTDQDNSVNLGTNQDNSANLGTVSNDPRKQ